MDQIPYPRVIISDLHAHERTGKSRPAELTCLTAKIKEINLSLKAETLIICGDLFDNNSPISYSLLNKLCDLFALFKRTILVMGNHDTPYRSASFSNMTKVLGRVSGVTCITKVTKIGDSVFCPYYDTTILMQDTESFSSTKERHIYAHKDILELNKFADTENAISIKDIPACTFFINGHLHRSACMSLPNGGQYVQLGAPYATSYSDDVKDNNFVHIAHSVLKVTRVATNVLGQEDNPVGFSMLRPVKAPSSHSSGADEEFQSLDERTSVDLSTILDDINTLSDKEKTIITGVFNYANQKIKGDVL